MNIVKQYKNAAKKAAYGDKKAAAELARLKKILESNPGLWPVFVQATKRYCSAIQIADYPAREWLWLILY